MATIGPLIAKLQLEATQFLAGIQSAKSATEGFASTARSSFAIAAVAIGAVTVAGRELYESLKQQQEKIFELGFTSSRLGVGVGAMQELRFAAQQTEVSVGTLNVALRFMEKSVGAAEHGVGAAHNALEILGLNARDLAAMKPEQELLAISDAMKGITDQNTQMYIATALFGRGGSRVLSLMKSDVRGLMDEYKSLGIELSENQVNSVEKFTKTTKELGTVWEGFN